MQPSLVRSRTPRRLVLPGLALAAGLTACPLLENSLERGVTQVEGTPHGVRFDDASAGHRVEPSGATELTVVRIAPRPDVCAAVLDPVDRVDPSLILTLSGAQPQSYQVVGLDYAGPPGGGPPPPTATVVLLTYEFCDEQPDLDAGVEDAGPQCAVNRAAHSGQVVLESIETGGRARGSFDVEFPAGGGAVRGVFDAPTCSVIR